MRTFSLVSVFILLLMTNVSANEETGRIKREFYASGNVFSETNCLDNNSDGFYHEYYENGNLKQSIEYKSGQLDGDYRDYCEDGTLRVKFKYKNNKRDGMYKLFYANGNLEYKGMYIDGLEDGEHRVYYPNGTLAAIATYKQGNEIGSAKTYYEDGTIREEFNFKEGIKDGDYREYHPSGVLKSQAVYKMGQLISNSNYDEERELFIRVLEEKLVKPAKMKKKVVPRTCQSELVGVVFPCNPRWELARNGKKLIIHISKEPLIVMTIEEKPQQIRFLSEFSRSALESMNRYASDFHMERFNHCNRESIKVNGYLKDDPSMRLSDYYLIDHHTVHAITFTVQSVPVWEESQWMIKEIVDGLSFTKQKESISYSEEVADSCADLLQN